MRTKANPRNRRNPWEMCSTHLTNKPDQGQGHIVFGWIDHPVPQYSVRSLSLLFILYAVTPPTSLLPSAGVLRGGLIININIIRKLVV